VKIFFENQSIFGEDMDKDNWEVFVRHSVVLP